jgi:phosphoribosyl-ATP pyrophosphohydrolase/phosphoribosyl-AMP cyclohydrolase
VNSDEVGTLDWDKVDGLIPAIVQDAVSGRVLMLGYMNQEALRRTLEEREVTFFSRIRKTLWTKGETSGHRLDVVAVTPDCDGDTLLVLARPRGPTCHNGSQSCFGDISDTTPAADRYAFLARLDAVIAARIAARPEGSWPACLAAAAISGTLMVLP